MKSLLGYIALTLCLLLGGSLCAQPSEGAVFDVSATADGGYSLRFRLGAVALQPAGGDTAMLLAEGLPSLAPRAGLPALPRGGVLLSLPRGCRLHIKRQQPAYLTMQLPDSGYHYLAPYTGAAVKDRPAPRAAADKKVYASATAYSAGAPLVVEDLGTMGQHQVVRLSVHPAVYRPAEATVQLLTALDATLTVTGPKSGAATAWPRRYLIVSRPEYREGLQPFVRWKRQEGYDVVELYATSHLRDSIQALLAPHFDPATAIAPPDYLLLVGDVQQLQAYIGTHAPEELGTHATDLYYADHTGDLLPDALTGRWPVNDTAQLNAIVSKTLRYEQGRTLDTAQLRRVLLVAGQELRDPAPITTNGQVTYLGRETKLAHPTLDTVCYHNPASGSQRSEILDDIARGNLLVNYTAHCSNAGWTLPSVTYNHFATLDENQPAIYVNNCCSSNDYSGTCLGEQLLRKPVGGAVGVIGATNSTLWNEDYYWAVGAKYPFSLEPDYDATRLGAFDGWLGRADGIETLGQLLAAGNLAVSAAGSPYDIFYRETYCLLGDPSLRLYTGAPQQAALQATGIVDGATEIGVAATPGAIVTLLQGDSLLGAVDIDATGHGQLALRQSLDSRPAVITASGPNLMATVDTVAVSAATGRAATLRNVTAGDNSIDCVVENIGSLPLDSLQIHLVQDAADSAFGAWIAPQSLTIDNLPPQAQAVATLPVSITATAMRWQATLRLQLGTDSLLCRIVTGHSLPYTPPAATFRLLEADSSTARRLLAGRDYLLETSTTGLSDSLRLAVTALPTTDTVATLLSTNSLTLSPIASPTPLTHLHVQAALHGGAMTEHYGFYLVASHGMDCFEEGMGSYPWQTGGTAGWTVDSNVSHTGRFSLRSGAIDYRQTTDLGIDLLLPQPDSISFWMRTSTENRYDKLLFSIDGQVQGDGVSGETPWRRYSYPLGIGQHSLRWRYVKDESTSAGSDCVWIDDVGLPLALWDAPYGWFGDPSTLGIGTANGEPQLHVSPNPTAGPITLGNRHAGSLRLLDLYGRCLYDTPVEPNATVDLTTLADGLYILLFRTHQGITIHKLIIQH